MEAKNLAVCNGKKDTPTICIIGAGISGICAAVQLQKQLGLQSFTIYDSNEDVGGTWFWNRYPGSGCDVQSHFYSLSFEKNPDWTSNYAHQPEIWRYLQKIAKKHDIYPHVKFNTDVKSLHWDDTLKQWKVIFLDKASNNNEEEELFYDIILNGFGGLHVPHIPEKFLQFQGPRMHSYYWDSSVELEDKIVAVIGTGASAIQIIPSIAPKVKKLHVYQRKPAWIVPRTQFDFPKLVKFLFAYVPFLMWFFRAMIFLLNEILFNAFFQNSIINRLAPKVGNYYRNRQLSNNPKVAESLRPKYPFGCKRVLVSHDYFPAMGRSNVEVHTSLVDKVTEDTIITKDGEEHKIDVLILATGFEVQDHFAPLKIFGKDGVHILDYWRKVGPQHYYGIVSNNMPNQFFVLGPNTTVGHSSVIFHIECQVNYIMTVIGEMMNRKAKCVTVKKEAEEQYIETLHANFKDTVWGNSECGSWYNDTNTGKNTVLFPRPSMTYWKQTKKVKFDVFHFE